MYIYLILIPNLNKDCKICIECNLFVLSRQEHTERENDWKIEIVCCFSFQFICAEFILWCTRIHGQPDTKEARSVQFKQMNMLFHDNKLLIFHINIFIHFCWVTWHSFLNCIYRISLKSFLFLDFHYANEMNTIF